MIHTMTFKIVSLFSSSNCILISRLSHLIGFSTNKHLTQYAVVQSLCLTLFNPMDWTPWQHARLRYFWELLKSMSIEWLLLPYDLILCHLFFLLFPIFPTIRVFSNELTLLIRWPKYRSFSFSISPSNEYLRLIPFRTSVKALVAQLCLTLCNPIDCSAPGSSVHGDSPVKSGLPSPCPGDLPNPGIKPGPSALQADSLLSEPPEADWLELLADQGTLKSLLQSQN